MSIIQGSAKQRSVRSFYPKVINGSLRFNDDDSAYLSWTPASAGNRKTWTWSGWVKRGNLGLQNFLFSSGADSSNRLQVEITSTDTINIEAKSGGATQAQLITTQVFRDPSAWYHIVIKVDTTQATSSSRVDLYINGEAVTAFSTATYPSQNADLEINKAIAHNLGKRTYTTNYLDAYLADVHFIDGQALTASDFGETKNGVWVAKDYAGTFGTNGFYLTFEDDTEVEAFNTVLYRGTGNGTVQSITGCGFQPDFVWIKNRSGAYHHRLYDAVRGTDLALMSTLTNAKTAGGLDSFDSDGFTVDGTTNFNNIAGNSYVAWCWKAGDSNVSNTDGTITSTVRANPTYGFSIVSYTGNTTTNQSVGHGLNAVPNFIITKNRGTTTDWQVYHSSVMTADNQQLELNNTNSLSTLSNVCWDVSNMTTTTFGVGSNNTTNGTEGIIAYCWAEKAGYSKFGSYTGNGSTSGPVVTGLGFTPAWVMIKRTDNTGGWEIWDNTRDVVNPIEKTLQANSSAAELTSGRDVQFDSDGFTIKNTTSNSNASGGTYIYAAFADTREAAFWLDQSGNDNDWQPVNLDHNDTVADSPTDNFCTLNPLQSSAPTYSNGNLRVALADNEEAFGTIAMTSGQWYWEVTYISSASSNNKVAVGIADADNPNNNEVVNYGHQATTYAVGDVIGVAVDVDAETISFYKNGTAIESDTSWSSKNWTAIKPFATSANSAGDEVVQFNFGQQPFKYNPPS